MAERPSGTGWLGRLGRMASASTPAGATGQTAAANILTLFLNLCTGVMTARFLGPAGRGELAAMTTWPQFMAFLCTFGLPAAITYTLKSHPARGRSLFWSMVILAAAMGLLAAVVGIGFLPHWLKEYPDPVVELARWAMVLAPISLLNICLTSVLQAREEFTFFNASRLAPPLCTLIFLSAAHWLSPLTSRSAAIATLLAFVPIFLLQFARLAGAYPFTTKGLPEANRLLLSYGARSYGISLVGALGGQLDRAILVGLVTPQMLGTYVVAANASLAVAAVPTALSMVLLPRASGRASADVVAMTGGAARASLLISVPAALALMAAGPLVIGLLYGQGFDEAVPVFRILLFEAVLRGLVVILSQAFMALNRPGLATVVDGAGLGVLILALIVLVPSWGLTGAAISLVASAAARLSLQLALFRSSLHLPLPRLAPSAADMKDLISRALGRAR